MLNVSGQLYQTSVPTLLADPNSRFVDIIKHIKPYKIVGVYRHFLDRHSKLFQFVLNHLRNGAITDLDDLPTDVMTLSLLKNEPIFFNLKSLSDTITRKMKLILHFTCDSNTAH